ncbi:hypothetical protein QCA50_002451 [Cerrena zonata]|uniref:Uncharacterized protein n=1 Tax=Cerrena zonata TaxID=2478898 RepID=A0AAW0GRI8_9APHY
MEKGTERLEGVAFYGVLVGSWRFGWRIGFAGGCAVQWLYLLVDLECEVLADGLFGRCTLGAWACSFAEVEALLPRLLFFSDRFHSLISPLQRRWNITII